jgi:uncharacterized iron-regulated protein
MKIIYIIIVSLFFQTVFSQNKQSYQIFDKSGSKTSYEKLLKSSLKSKVVLFGEFHDNSVIHWLELEFTKDIAAKTDIVLGAEMIETDNQRQLDNYMKGQINQKVLDSTARLWPNYKTDYKPLVDFAKENKIKFIATNIPRKYASLVFKKGLEDLDKLTFDEKKLMAPLPIEFDLKLPGYTAMLTMQGGKAGDKMPKAQAIKDATMASFIIKNTKDDAIFIHFNGTYHSENYEGIYWYLKRQDTGMAIVTIATVEQENIEKLEKENEGKADYIIVVDKDVTKTY